MEMKRKENVLRRAPQLAKGYIGSSFSRVRMRTISRWLDGLYRSRSSKPTPTNGLIEMIGRVDSAKVNTYIQVIVSSLILNRDGKCCEMYRKQLPSSIVT
jgi:hypothetical protein